MLEAIAMGAFPIQTNTSCCDEWITDGESGFIVNPYDVEGIAERIRTAVADDQLVNRAADLNWATVQKRLDQREVARQVHDLYEWIFEDISKRMSNRDQGYPQ
jgi:glycosyltransferase involved in cell wall biosynthesis